MDQKALFLSNSLPTPGKQKGESPTRCMDSPSGLWYMGLQHLIHRDKGKTIVPRRIEGAILRRLIDISGPKAVFNLGVIALFPVGLTDFSAIQVTLGGCSSMLQHR